MARILAAISRVLGTDDYREPAVHFHAHEARPEICYDERCSRPRLRVG